MSGSRQGDFGGERLSVPSVCFRPRRWWLERLPWGIVCPPEKARRVLDPGFAELLGNAGVSPGSAVAECLARRGFASVPVLGHLGDDDLGPLRGDLGPPGITQLDSLLREARVACGQRVRACGSAGWAAVPALPSAPDLPSSSALPRPRPSPR